MGETRRAFGLYLTHVLKRISSPGNELGVQHAALVLRFLKRASATLRMPYNVKGPPAKMCDKDRCAVIAKQLNDFLYMYYRETDLYRDARTVAEVRGNIHFAQFLYSASEADLEDVLLVQLRMENFTATFLGDSRNPFIVDLPPSRLAPLPPPRHTLLRHLAALAPANTRRYRPCSDQSSRGEAEESSTEDQAISFSTSDVVLKESLKEEKPLIQALKYARS
ncbi:hypothetical protein evm_014932 [Chilo suppressalis]|nr:hypothetical protein evm_014932 [Chilo suppressalis]